MAFLDNSGDIILDAVLTDLGRKRLASGKFNIAKFALGDEEINYELWNSSDARGSAFYDLEILQSPVLEAFTSDQSIMKSRLLTLSADNVLFMPILKINNTYDDCKPIAATGGYYLLADSKTFEVDNNATTTAATGFLHGLPGEFSSETTHICVDQGIDSSENGMSITQDIDGSLLETSYIVKMDHRLLRLQGFIGGKNATDSVITMTEQFIDDDSIATYYIVDSQQSSAIVGTRENIKGRMRHKITSGAEPDAIKKFKSREMFDGPLGSILRVTPRVSDLIHQGDSLFDEFGSSGVNLSFRGAKLATYKYIDTNITVTGATTGNSVDIPIRIIKGKTFST